MYIYIYIMCIYIYICTMLFPLCLSCIKSDLTACCTRKA